MTAPTPIHGGALTELAPGLWSEATGGGQILHGAPATLSRVCARLGFKNDCRRGRVFVHAGHAGRVAEAVRAEVRSCLQNGASQ